MKKKLALVLAGIMALGMVPMTAFAKTTNRISKVVVGQVDDVLTASKAPVLSLYGDDLDATTTEAFKLTLKNAEWEFDALEDAMSDYTVTKLSAKSVIIEGVATDTVDGDPATKVPMLVELTGKGDATVTVDPRESVYSAGEYKFATVTSGDVAVSIEGVRNVPENTAGKALKTLVLEETVSGTFEDGDLTLRLSKDWEFVGTTATDLGFTVYPAGAVEVTDIDVEGRDATLTLDVDETVEKAIVITFAPKVVWDADEIEAGDVCEITVDGAGVDKTTLEAAKAVTYGITWTAEDEALPEIYWGTVDETLDVTLEEAIQDSWLANRRTQIVFNEEVKVVSVEVEDENGQLDGDLTFKVDDNKLTFNECALNGTDVVELTFSFEVSVKPGYTGDITATLTGKGVDEDIEVVVAKAVAPVTVEVEKTDAVIDYRHTEIGAITITEADTGVLEDGSVLVLALDKLEFDDDPEAEVVAGDLTIDDVEVSDGKIFITIDDESVKEPATIKLTGATLFMDRNIPAGDYALKLKAYTTVSDTDEAILTWNGLAWDTVSEDKDVIFQNNSEDGEAYLWDKSSVTVSDNYVSVITAGRDVDESTFTTTLTVTVGATEMKANDKVITLDVPAYISNGYTMLPVRAITEALSGTAIVRWDDAKKQVTITFGSRVISMTVGSNVMTINGVEVPMLAACEITNGRAFIPLRDMGYALGLNDSAIKWDAATNTATLN